MVEERLKELNRLFSKQDIQRNGLSLEGLMDTLLVLYDECNSPVLRREKNVSEFLEIGEFEL